MKFKATVQLHGKTATGIAVPEEIVDALASGKRPNVVVTINGYSYRTTVAPMGGEFLIPLSAEHRTASGAAAGAEVEVDLVPDEAPRTVELPDDLSAALANDSSAADFFDGLSFSHRKEWVRWIVEAKKPETRATRVQRTVESLREGKRTR